MSRKTRRKTCAFCGRKYGRRSHALANKYCSRGCAQGAKVECALSVPEVDVSALTTCVHHTALAQPSVKESAFHIPWRRLSADYSALECRLASLLSP